MRMFQLAFLFVAISAIGPTQAEDVRAAVAANFTAPSKEIAVGFEKSTGHKLLLSFGATGQLYAQISQGAPFEILLSADRSTPEKAVSAGLATPGTVFTYAVGKLVLFSKDPNLVRGQATLKAGNFKKMAIANPATAPYGAAAVEVMKALGTYNSIEGRIVYGQNVSQTYQFIDTGNAELGFVALSQLVATKDGSRWLVPEHLHSAIRQDVVLLRRGERSDAARAFLSYLRSGPARAIIEKYGYGVE